MTPDWQSILSQVLSYLPDTIAGSVTALIPIFVALCAVAARVWPRPADESKWLFLYKIVNGIGMNGKRTATADATNTDDVKKS